jgi:hypothetical protein
MVLLDCDPALSSPIGFEPRVLIRLQEMKVADALGPSDGIHLERRLRPQMSERGIHLCIVPQTSREDRRPRTRWRLTFRQLARWFDGGVVEQLIAIRQIVFAVTL